MPRQCVNPALAAAPGLPDPFAYLDPKSIDHLVSFTIEARRGGKPVPEHKIKNVAVPQKNGRLLAWHVTDVPDRVLRELKAGSELSVARQTGDLGGGLYVSAVPHLWRGRSRRRWSWMNEITSDQVRDLIGMVEVIIAEARATRYITAPEYEDAQGDIDRAREEWTGTLTGSGPRDWLRGMIIRLANQPYNIQFHRDILPKLKVASLAPEEVEVELEGRFVDRDVVSGKEGHEFEDRTVKLWITALAPQAKTAAFRAYGSYDELLNTFLRGVGIDGIFGAGTPQLLVWSNTSVRRFGRWQNPRPYRWPK